MTISLRAQDCSEPAIPLRDPDPLLSRSGATPAGELRLREARLASLLQAHYRIVWRTLRRMGVVPDRVDDAAQEVFIIVARKLDCIEAGCERKYLLSTAVRVAANFRRARAARPEFADDETIGLQRDFSPGPEQLLDQKRTRELLDEVLDSMSRDLRTVFVLFELEGMSVPEIAELVDAPIGTIASRLRRARGCFQAAAKRVRARTEFRGGTT